MEGGTMAVSGKTTKELLEENKLLRSRVKELESSGTKDLRNSEQEIRRSHERLITVLDSLDALVYVADMETHEILFANKFGRDIWGDVIGKTCWKKLQSGQKGPCEFCTNAKLIDSSGRPTGIYRWEFQNTVDQQWYECRDQAIKWTDERFVRMEIATKITEQKNAQDELKKSKEFLDNIINSLDDSFFVKDQNHCWLMLNDAACELMGRPREELIGKSDYELFPKEQANVFWEKDNVVFETGRTNVNEEQVTWQGKLHTISTKKSLYTDPVTSEKFITGTIRDITERKKIEVALRESEFKYRTTLNSMRDAIHVVDTDLRIILMNEKFIKWAKELGIEIDQPINRNIFDLFPFLPDKVRDEYRHVLDTGNALTTTEMTQLAGRKIFSESRKIPICEADKVVRIITIIRDITETKKAEQAIRESEEKFRTLAEQSPNMIFINKGKRILYANKKCEEITGYERAEFYSPDFDFHILISPQSLDLVKENFRKHSEGLDIPPYEYTVINKAGEKIEAINSSKLIQYEGRTAILVIVTDITEWKKAERRIKEQNDFLKLIIESLKHPFYIIDASDYTIKMLNSAACSTPIHEGQTCYNLTHNQQRPCSGSEHKCTLEEIKKTNEPVIIQHNHVDQNGNPRYIEVHGYPIFDKQGDVVQIIEYCLDITDRKQLEEAYRSLVDNSLQGLTIVQDGRMVFFNKAFRAITGYNEEELLAASPEQIQSLVHPEDRELVWTRYRDRLAGNPVPPRYEYRCILKDGSTCWVEIYASRIEYKGRPAIQAAYFDVTDQKEAEKALKESEAKYRSLIANIPGIVWTTNEKGSTVFISKNITDIYGYTPEEIYDEGEQFWFGRIHPDDVERVKKAFEAVFKEEVPLDIEYRIRRKDGEWIWIRDRSIGAYEKDGVKYADGVLFDITERKKAEEALRQNEQRLKILFESAPDAIYLNDMEGNFVDGNKAAEKMVGYAKEELIGKSFAEAGLLSSEHLLRALANLEKNAMGKPTGPDEFTLIRKDGSTVPVEIRSFPVRIGDQVLSLGIARDISSHKEAEQKLFEHRAQLKSLASELSLTEERERHRLATDLHDHISQALVFSRIKLQELHASVSSDEIALPLEEACNNLDQIIQDTRTLTFDLSSPILYELGFEAAVSEWLETQIEQKHGIKTQFRNDGLPKPLEDNIRVLLFRDVRELLINVVKHAEAQNVKVSISRINQQICVRVEDDGMGFNPAEVALNAGFGIFSISERLEQLAGHIEIESEPGQGTKITMTAPLKCDEISKENKLKS